MSADSIAMGHVIYHAAIEIAQGRKISVKAAVVAACRMLNGDAPFQEVYGPMAWKECMRFIGYIGPFEAFPVSGGWRGGHWYTPEVKSWVVIFLLFCYEYCVSEISGGQGRIFENVTPCNTGVTYKEALEEAYTPAPDLFCDGSQTDLCRFESTRCDDCPMKGSPNCP